MLATAVENDHRGQVGIGTLIVFIAMVVVAALAAGVLISTASQLQSQAEATGADSTAKVTNNLEVLTAVGTVSADSETIERVEITVGLGPGSGAIDLADVAIDYNGPYEQTYLDVGPDHVREAETVLQTGTDRGTIIVDVPGRLEAGDEVDVTLVTANSSQTSISLTVPYVLEADDTVGL